jgi:hypothetical protein
VLLFDFCVQRARLSYADALVPPNGFSPPNGSFRRPGPSWRVLLTPPGATRGAYPVVRRFQPSLRRMAS